jgi:hypothetical protein
MRRVRLNKASMKKKTTANDPRVFEPQDLRTIEQWLPEALLAKEFEREGAVLRRALDSSRPLGLRCRLPQTAIRRITFGRLPATYSR